MYFDMVVRDKYNQIMYPQMGDFNNFDEAAKFIYDVIAEEKLEEIPLEIIKRDLLLMTNGNIEAVGFPLIPRYIGTYGSEGYGKWLKQLIWWYNGNKYIANWKKQNKQSNTMIKRLIIRLLKLIGLFFILIFCILSLVFFYGKPKGTGINKIERFYEE